jgi:hypothetical protein
MAYYEGATPLAAQRILNWRAWCHRGDSVVPIDFHSTTDRGEARKPMNEPEALAVEGLYRKILKHDPRQARCIAFSIFGGQAHRIKNEFVSGFRPLVASQKMDCDECLSFEKKEQRRANLHRHSTKLLVRDWLQSFYGEVDRLPIGGADLPKISQATPHQVSGLFTRAEKRDVSPKSNGWA